jgi:uncharacterized membrane protein YcaP (DUF421 family)
MSFIEYIREPKIPFTGGMVAFDWIMSYLFAVLISNKFYNNENVLTIFIIIIILSIFIHYILDIPTVTNYYLNLSSFPIRNS